MILFRILGRYIIYIIYEKYMEKALKESFDKKLFLEMKDYYGE